MSSITFIHCADLHIDSPFKGLAEVDNDLRDRLYKSTYASFDNIINLAIKENVDCFLVAGDIYDGADKSLQAQIKFRDGLLRLSEASIPSFVVYGNHDPSDSWSATLEWPNNVTIFGGKGVDCVALEKNGEHISDIYGISFPKRHVHENLSKRFNRSNENIPAICLLHANVGNNTEHDPYAPATIKDLVSREMDYWALGHIHVPKILKSSHPAIIYAGNTQARNPREIGAKGCFLITLHENGDCDKEFIATDIVRYQTDRIDISSCSSIDDVINKIKGACEDISSMMDGRNSVIRLSLHGRSVLHTELRRVDSLSDILSQIREHFEARDPWIWLERLILNTSGTYDIESLKHGSDLIADIINLYDKLESDNDDSWKTIHQTLDQMYSTWQAGRYLEKFSNDELLAIAREARSWTLDLMIKSE